MYTDQKIQLDVVEKVKFEPSLDASHINVSVKGGMVTLSGVARSYFDKKIAERIVQNVAGVKGIADELKVDFPAMSRRTDEEIANAAVNALLWDVQVPYESIKVIVEDDRVVLTGEVDWWYQRESAEKTVRRLQGVKDISNQIVITHKIKPGITADDIKTEIIKEFERNAEIDAKKLQIEISGSKVILRGNVSSWAEYREDKRAAWSVPGVTDVENHLNIIY